MQIKLDPTTYYMYAFTFSFEPSVVEFCRLLKTAYGWRNFNYVDNAWRFNDMRIAMEIKNRYPKAEINSEIETDYVLAKIRLEKTAGKEKEAERIKNAKKSTIVIDGLKDKLYPYQKLGVEFLANSDGRAILADQMGTGKSVQSLAYALYTKKKKILVICPASVKHSWNNEVKKWTKLKSEVVNSKSNKKIFTDPKTQVVIINYDIVIKFYDAIVAGNFDALVVDEFTYIKNSSARRTKVVKQISKIIPSVILLSGTPILSRPVELFNGLNIIDRNTWSNYYDYTLRYCNGHQGRWGWDARGASNIDELQQKINKYFIRRTKEEVLPELPKKIFIKRPVELESSIQQEYTMAINEFGEFLREYRNKKTPEILRSLQAEKLVKLGELRQLTSRGKINAAEDIINETIEDEEKILVFSCYNEPLEKLYDKFKKQAVIITGKTSEDDRKKAIELFQSDPKIKIFFGGIKSAGMGITLTSATNVLFVDYSWTPADHAQAIDRLHRPGQKALEVNIYYLYALDTIDEYMTKLLEKKQRIFDRLIEGESKEVHFPGGNMMKNVLQMLEREAKKAGKGKLDLIKGE